MIEPATPLVLKRWLHFSQVEFLNSLSCSRTDLCDSIRFQGGNALRLGWGSDRFSEDLDFLVDDRLTSMLDSFVKCRVTAELSKRLKNRPDMHDVKINLKERARRSDKRLIDYCLTIASPRYMGTAKLNLEFWPATTQQIQAYESTPSTMGGRLDAELPLGTLESIFHDKVVALCGRPFVKMRDIYDVWWITRETPVKLDVDRFLAHSTPYNFDACFSDNGGESLVLARDDASHLAKLRMQMDGEMKRWLSPLRFSTQSGKFGEMVALSAGLSSQVYESFKGKDERVNIFKTSKLS